MKIIAIENPENISGNLQTNCIDIFAYPLESFKRKAFYKAFSTDHSPQENAESASLLLLIKLSLLNKTIEEITKIHIKNRQNIFAFCIEKKEDIEYFFVQENLAKSFKDSYYKIKKIAFIPCELAQQDKIFSLLTAQNFSAAIITSKVLQRRLYEDYSVEEIAHALSNAKKYGLAVGLSGKMEPPDTARFLPLPLDYLCFSMQDISHNQALLEQHKKKIRKKVKIFQEKLDELHIKDFIIPANIGAYHYEMGRKQNICFNIIAQVKNPPAMDEVGMEDVFSYDIILDGIKMILASQHFLFVEVLAETVASFILEHDAVKKVTIRVEKLELGPKAVGIEIERSIAL